MYMYICIFLYICFQSFLLELLPPRPDPGYADEDEDDEDVSKVSYYIVLACCILCLHLLNLVYLYSPFVSIDGMLANVNSSLLV